MIKQNKKASIYIFALATAMVLVSLVVGLSAIVMQFRRNSRTNTQIDRAKIYAELGIRHALYFTSVEPNWRSMLKNGTWLQDIPIDQATYTVTGIDPDDGSLIDGDEFTIELTCTAMINRTRQTLSVLAQNYPSELLKYAVAAGGLLKISNLARINGNASTNDSIDKTGADSWILGNAEAVGIINEERNITGIIAPGSDPKSFPDAQAITDYYLRNATPIPFQNLIENVLITPNFNPFGPPNPDGIYSIDCAGQKIVIRNCRILGTIILINPKSDSTIGEGINWHPAGPHLPALIIDGTIKINPTKDLSEADAQNELNLPHEPNFGDLTTIFPNLINGPIFCRGN
ncbi:MAG: hypothetical protein GY869_17030, partial [Planctomycetes bacterium]|nr:hypothetical protein [Planctomycetota bacterium]